MMLLDGKTKHLVLFDYGLFDEICGKKKYVTSKKRGITNSINYNFGKIRVNSYNSRSSRPEVFCKKGSIRNFAKFTGKHLCQRLFFNKVACLGM